MGDYLKNHQSTPIHIITILAYIINAYTGQLVISLSGDFMLMKI